MALVTYSTYAESDKGCQPEADKLWAEAKDHEKQGKYKKALTLLNELIKKYPKAQYASQCRPDLYLSRMEFGSDRAYKEHLATLGYYATKAKEQLPYLRCYAHKPVMTAKSPKKLAEKIEKVVTQGDREQLLHLMDCRFTRFTPETCDVVPWIRDKYVDLVIRNTKDLDWSKGRLIEKYGGDPDDAHLEFWDPETKRYTVFSFVRKLGLWYWEGFGY